MQTAIYWIFLVYHSLNQPKYISNLNQKYQKISTKHVQRVNICWSNEKKVGAIPKSKVISDMFWKMIYSIGWKAMKKKILIYVSSLAGDCRS